MKTGLRRTFFSGLSWWSILAVLVAGLGFPAAARAGRLVFDVTAHATVRQDGVEVLLDVTNRGDEAALDIRAEAPGQYPLMESKTADRLEAGGTVRLELRLDHPGPKQGTYVRIVLVNFKDLNGHPFTAPAQVRFHVGQPADSLVQARAEPLSFSDRRLVKITLTNQGEKPLEVKLTAFSPKELSVGQPESPVKLLPGKSRTISFDLWNRSGIAGSTYPVMVLVEHDRDGRHTAQIVQVMATLTARSNPIRNNLKWWLASIGAVFGLFLVNEVQARRMP